MTPRPRRNMNLTSWLSGEKDATTETEFLDPYVRAALWFLALIVIVATVTGQVESFNGLYIWFATHHVTGIWADFAPLAVDSFTVIGELAIFAGIARRWDVTSRILPWVSAIIGICASIAANVGDKVQYHNVPTDITGAIFPVAGAFGIIIGLGVLKRVAKDIALKNTLAREAEMMPASIMISSEGLRELQNEQFEVPVKPLEAPKRLDPIEPAASPTATSAEPPYGLDVLIPPRESTWADIVQPPTGPMPVEDTRGRQRAHPRYDRGLVETGEIPAIA
jgi:hypothetical protein